MDTASNSDPTGFVPAALAAVKLVGAVAKVAPTVVHAVDVVKNHNAANAGSYTVSSAGGDLNRSASQPQVPITAERENRAYETVNYVLRTLGNRIGEAGLVSAPALAKALTAASTHIEVELFSVNANRLFKSLASKLQDAVLVNSVFTSIYFIGAITAELSRSLPNYKSTYVPLGPCIVQHIFRAAIGEDAFRENQQANIEAYKTLATTAGLLRPTDLGYAIFPDFPSLSPTRYSSKSYTDVRNHKNIFEKLIKHFDTHGFPQPLPGRDVGPIKDWRFLSGDANSRWYEVEKADKHIGESIGRVLYWLICGADRMPAGMGVIAYYKQHIELIQWMGTRFGYRVLTANDLDLSGPHSRLENKYRSTIEAWVVICPSLTMQTNMRPAVVDWNQMNQTATPASRQNSNASISHRPSISSSIASMETSTMTGTQHQSRSIGIGSAIANAGAAARRTESYPKLNPAAGIAALSSPINPHMESPTANTTIVISPESQSAAGTPATEPTSESSINMSPPPYQQAVSPNNPARPSSGSAASGPTTAPSYFPPLPSPASGPNVGPSQPAAKNPGRRRAPPPPRRFTPAKALYDFAPEEEGGEELTFKEGDDLEIVEKNAELEADGWCKARVKGSNTVGLAPLDYLEEVKVRAPPPPAAALERRAAPGPSSSSAHTNARSLSGGSGSFGTRGLQNTPVPRSASTSSAPVRALGTMQPQLVGIHESPNHPQLAQLRVTSVSPQNSNSRPLSMAVPNSSVHSQSHIPINPRMQHNQYAHPVHTTHPQPVNQQTSYTRPSSAQQSTQVAQQSSETMQPQTSYQHISERLQATELIDSSVPQTSTMARGSTPKPTSGTSGSIPNRISTPTQRPPSKQSFKSQNQSSLQYTEASCLTSSRQIPNSNHHNFAPNISLNLGSHSGLGTHPRTETHSGFGPYSELGTQNHFHHAQPPYSGNSSQSSRNSPSNLLGSMSNYGGSSNNQQYNNPSADSDASPQSYNNAIPEPSTQTYNPQDPSVGNYNNQYSDQSPQNISGGSTYVYEPTTFDATSDGGGGVINAGLSYLAGTNSDSGDGDTANPASSMNFSTDLASIDPFYAAMNPGFASAGPATPTDTSAGAVQIFGDANTGPNGDEPSSPQASLSVGEDNASQWGGEQGVATDAFGNVLSSNPLADMAQNNGSNTSFGGMGGLGVETGQGGDGTGFGGPGDQNASDDTASYGDGGLGFNDQDKTMTGNDMVDNDDDEFGYAEF